MRVKAVMSGRHVDITQIDADTVVLRRYTSLWHRNDADGLRKQHIPRGGSEASSDDEGASDKENAAPARWSRAPDLSHRVAEPSTTDRPPLGERVIASVIGQSGLATPPDRGVSPPPDPITPFRAPAGLDTPPDSRHRPEENHETASSAKAFSPSQIYHDSAVSSPSAEASSTAPKLRETLEELNRERSYIRVGAVAETPRHIPQWAKQVVLTSQVDPLHLTAALELIARQQDKDMFSDLTTLNDPAPVKYDPSKHTVLDAANILKARLGNAHRRMREGESARIDIPIVTNNAASMPKSSRSDAGRLDSSADKEAANLKKRGLDDRHEERERSAKRAR